MSQLRQILLQILNDTHLDQPSSLELPAAWRCRSVASCLCIDSRKTISCEDQRATCEIQWESQISVVNRTKSHSGDDL